MQLLIMIVIGLMLLILLSVRLVGFDRGVDLAIDASSTTAEASDETPVIDTAPAEAAPAIRVPVQYIDNGLLPKIEKNLSGVQEVLAPMAFGGPEAFHASDEHVALVTDVASDAFTVTAGQTREVESALAAVPDPAGDPEELEPYNSFAGMIVSSNQMTGSVDAAPTPDTAVETAPPGRPGENGGVVGMRSFQGAAAAT